MDNKTINQKGFVAILFVLLVLAAMFSITASISSLSYKQQKIARSIIESSKAYYAAEAGAEDATYRVKNEMTISSNYSLTVGDSLAQITVSGTDLKTINSLGKNKNANRKIRTVISKETINPQFFYGVQVGEGGLIMNNGSSVYGNIYSDGTISGGSNTVITGDATIATGSILGEQSTVQNQDQIFGQSSPVLDLAQQFSPNSSTAGSLVQISFYIKKVGNPSNVTVRILTDNSDKPTKTVLASATLNATSVGSSYSWVPVTFSSPPTLVAATKYWIMIDTSANASNYWVWGRDSNNGYGNGIARYSANWNDSSPVWSDPITGDLAFKTSIGGQITSLNSMIVYGTARANTITSSSICGDAYYKSIDSSSLTFLNSPSSPCPTPFTPGTAYPNSEDPSVVAMPISQGNINDWEAAAEAGAVYGPGSPQCTPLTNMEIGPARLNCDWTVANGKIITIKGPIWVNGDIVLSNNSVLKLDSSFGNDLSTVLIADAKDPPSQGTKGKISVSNNVIVCGSEGYNPSTNQCYPRQAENKSYLMFLSTYSGTSGYAITIANNAVGAIFYASNGTVSVSNNAGAKEVTGYKIEMSNNSTITYESGLYDAKFSSGPGASWQIQQWQEVE
jgi:Tfp pilus assembly protein PilX